MSELNNPYNYAKKRVVRPKPDPPPPDVVPGFTDTTLWITVEEAVKMNTGDEIEARRVADRVGELVTHGRQFEKIDQDAARKQQRQKQLRKWRNRGLNCVYGLIVAGALGFISWGLIGVAHSNDNDWAGYGPQDVTWHAHDAIIDYFGQNDLPSNMQVVAKKRVSLYGDPAWFVLYKTPGRKQVCAYVWKGGDYESKVEEGANCHI